MRCEMCHAPLGEQQLCPSRDYGRCFRPCACAECVQANEDFNRKHATLPRHGTLNRWGGMGSTTYGKRY